MFTHDWLKKYGNACNLPGPSWWMSRAWSTHGLGLIPRAQDSEDDCIGEIMKLRCRVVRLDQQEAVRVKAAM